MEYRITVQEYLHKKNGDVEEGKYSEFEGSVADDHRADLVEIFESIYDKLFPPTKPFRMFRSCLEDPDPDVEGQRVRKRVYKVLAWTSDRGHFEEEIIRDDLE